VDAAGLVAIAGSTQPLSAAQPGAEQIAFVQNGAVLVVTEKGQDSIDTFVVTSGVAAQGRSPRAGTSMAPYGFGVYGDGLIVVTQATATTGASSYSVSANGVVTTEAALVADGQLAACWLTIVNTTAYALNAHNATISATRSLQSPGRSRWSGAASRPRPAPARLTSLPARTTRSSTRATVPVSRSPAGPLPPTARSGRRPRSRGTPASSSGLVVR